MKRGAGLTWDGGRRYGVHTNILRHIEYETLIPNCACDEQ